ncbi:ribonuclease III domain-containing protein [Aspergillus lucknowensis]|uniref:Ribonuclease III domain-containing protein n=1 Tax=Aspergillus lucknowensis TaxID=176173 RepID=A0ABR4LV94_9EURO
MPSLIAYARTTTNNLALAFQTNFDLRFNDETLLLQALTAPGALGATSIDGNKGLAHIGDSALELYLRDEGFERGLTRNGIKVILDEIVSNKALAKRGVALGLDGYIQNNPSQGRVVSEGTMANTMEAIIGAYFKDQGMDFQALRRVIMVLGLGWPEGGEEEEREREGL